MEHHLLLHLIYLEDKEADLSNKEKNDEKVMILFGAPGSVMIGTNKSYVGNLVQICGGNSISGFIGLPTSVASFVLSGKS